MRTLGRIRVCTSRTALALIFLLAAPLAFSQQGSSSPALAKLNERSTLCRPGSLPPGVQSRLKGEFSSWKVQEPADLSPRARERWESEKPLACPGIAVGKFENAKMPSYAVLLVPREHTDTAGYKFLVFTQTGQQSYGMRTADSGDSGGANFFIHQTLISKFFDEPSRKKFQARTPDGILLLDSAENEYGAEVYFWSGGGYRHEPIDY